jgi:hypothetical protein
LRNAENFPAPPNDMPSDAAPDGPVPLPRRHSTGPGFTPNLPEELLPAEFRSILVRLRQRFGSALHVIPTDTEWVEVTVDNLSAAEVQSKVQSERNVLFGNADSRVQVILPVRPSGSEIHLHLLSEPNWGDRTMMAAYGK